MNQFLHDLALFSSGWAVGLLVYHVWSVLIQVWPEIKAAHREWKNPDGKSN